MTPARFSPLIDVFREYERLYKIRNDQGGELDTNLEKEWNEITFTLDSIFSGLYRPDLDTLSPGALNSDLRNKLAISHLRVPTETDVLCETSNVFFSGKLQDISTGGAYVHASIPFHKDSRVRLTFCTFREQLPLELEGRIAWSNPKSMHKPLYLEGAGVEFTDCDQDNKAQLDTFIYELVEETLVKANLI
jgi:uncharacterized protein (TIGR02266 family)